MRADAIELVTENRRAHGVHEAVTRTARTVMCTVESVSRTEFYNALNSGVTPEYVFRLTLAEDYQGERLVEYHGQTYRVVRTYMTADDGIEITVERSEEDGPEDDPDDSNSNSNS